MFGEMSLFAWMGGAIVFAIGGGAGFFIARQIKDQRTLELEKQLESTKNALSDYQQDVQNHFLKTSLLFNKLTDDYRSVYAHLADGAEQLCGDRVNISDTALTAPSDATSEKPHLVEVAQPLDYAPKKPDEQGQLSEDFGLDKSHSAA